MTNIFLDLLIVLGCAIVFGLICIVLALAFGLVRGILTISKEASKECSAVKTVKNDTSDVTPNVKNT